MNEAGVRRNGPRISVPETEKPTVLKLYRDLKSSIINIFVTGGWWSQISIQELPKICHDMIHQQWGAHCSSVVVSAVQYLHEFSAHMESYRRQPSYLFFEKWLLESYHYEEKKGWCNTHLDFTNIKPCCIYVLSVCYFAQFTFSNLCSVWILWCEHMNLELKISDIL